MVMSVKGDWQRGSKAKMEMVGGSVMELGRLRTYSGVGRLQLVWRNFGDEEWISCSNFVLGSIADLNDQVRICQRGNIFLR